MIKMRRGIPSPIPIQIGTKSVAGVISPGIVSVAMEVVTVMGPDSIVEEIGEADASRNG